MTSENAILLCQVGSCSQHHKQRILVLREGTVLGVQPPPTLRVARGSRGLWETKARAGHSSDQSADR